MVNSALLVGINKYKMAGSDLSDILLRHFGFTTKDIRICPEQT
jgi:hypothetical protein